MSTDKLLKLSEALTLRDQGYAIEGRLKGPGIGKDGKNGWIDLQLKHSLLDYLNNWEFRLKPKPRVPREWHFTKRQGTLLGFTVFVDSLVEGESVTVREVLDGE